MKKTEKILSRWAQNGYYVYLRPLTSKFIDASKPHSLYWRVQVECRQVPPGRYDGEGYDLDEIILELNERVPRGKPLKKKPKHAGWLAPEKTLKAEIRKAKGERPRKRPKKGKK